MFHIFTRFFNLLYNGGWFFLSTHLFEVTLMAVYFFPFWLFMPIFFLKPILAFS